MGIARQVFTANGNWVAPGGVFYITVIAKKALGLANMLVPNQTSDSNGGASVFIFDALFRPYGLGGNFNGQLGINTSAAVSSPTLIAGGLTLPSFFFPPSNLGNKTPLISPNGQMFCMGLNTNGELGTGSVTSVSSPTQVVGSQIWAKAFTFGWPGNGNNNMFALDANGKAWSWGGNLQGELGVNDVVPRSVPTAVVGGLSFVNFVSSQTNGQPVMFGLLSTGQAYAWGGNQNGNQGVGDVVPRSSPVAVAGGLLFSSLTGTLTYTLGVASGVLYSWGANTNGQLGTNDVVPRSSPTVVVGGLTNWLKVWNDPATNGASVAATLADGTPYCWGQNFSGSCGVNDIVPRSSPTAVVGGLKFSQIVGQGASFCALTSAGVAYSWGQNSSGQLGTNDVNPRSSPTAVVGGLTFQYLWMTRGGSMSVFGLTAGNQIYGWGDNTTGLLGTGDVLQRSSPVLIHAGITLPLPTAPYYTQRTDLTVVPGTSYAVALNQYLATLGSNTVGQGFVDSITIQYEQ